MYVHTWMNNLNIRGHTRVAREELYIVVRYPVKRVLQSVYRGDSFGLLLSPYSRVVTRLFFLSLLLYICLFLFDYT